MRPTGECPTRELAAKTNQQLASMTTAGNLTVAAYFNYQWRLELEFAPHRFVDSLLFTQFGDKVTILRKSPRFPFERKTKFKDDMRNVEKLRDKIAHANDFASTPAAAEGVCRTVRSLDCWVRRLDSWPAVADPPEIPRKQV